ncbi:hypothetical protein JZ751_011977 [Albula glossodonta]|uniref:Uncharacterized protein n=1 Tax=Albula glossodonta TaxID=121402 RepID=A0A8T2PR63_9TELE|nr:hypothetical protein JZ751_011977 [Albula glossodonta]
MMVDEGHEGYLGAVEQSGGFGSSCRRALSTGTRPGTQPATGGRGPKDDIANMEVGKCGQSVVAFQPTSSFQLIPTQVREG